MQIANLALRVNRSSDHMHSSQAGIRKWGLLESLLLSNNSRSGSAAAVDARMEGGHGYLYLLSIAVLPYNRASLDKNIF